MSAAGGAAGTAGGVVLRDMTLADIPAVSALERRLFPADAWPLHMFFDELSQPDTRRYLVAEAASGLVGYAGLMCIEPIADVQTIAVVPDSRAGGIGSALLTRSSGRPDGAAPRTSCWRSGRTTRAPSSCTCASGSSRSMSARRYYRDGVDALIMRLQLADPADAQPTTTTEADQP